MTLEKDGMAQSLLLNTDAAITSNITGENRIKNQSNQSANSDGATTESFSSALDRQVDKQVDKRTEQQTVQQNKKTDKATAADKTAKAEQKNSKESSDKLTETTDNSADKDSQAVKKEETESSKDETLNTTISTETISDNNTVDDQDVTFALAGQADVIKDSTIKSDNNKHIAENSKSTSNVLLSNSTNAGLNEEKGEKTEQKQGLRSDILNALSKKLDTQGNKQDPVVNKEGVSDKQKIIALANNIQLKESLLTSGGVERSSNVSPALQTAPSISNSAVQGQPILNLQPSLQSEAWGRVLSSRVIWMAREGVQQASLKLNPASMGLVEVKLHMHNEQASISFIAHHAATRDALEQALPRLRENFQENGMELVHADVSQENFSQADEQDNNKTTNNGSTSRRDKNDADAESTAHDVNITEQDIVGVSVFA